MIPVVFSLSILGTIPALAFGGTNPASAVFCIFGPSIILFVIGLLVLINGMEKHQVVTPKNVVTEIHHYYEPKNKDYQTQPFEREIDKNLEEKQEHINYCYRCGVRIEGNPVYCYSCGTKLR